MIENTEELKPATPEEIALASKSGAELLAERAGFAKTIKRKAALYGKEKFSKFTPKKVFECRNYLMAGEDPFYLALYYNVAFHEVAKIANNILEVREHESGKTLGRIPTRLPDYLRLAERVEAARQKAAEEKRNVAEAGFEAAKGEQPAEPQANS